MLVPVTPPAIEPVTLARAKAHLRLEIDADDDLVAGLIKSARRLVEREQDRALISQQWDWFLDGFPPLTDARDMRQRVVDPVPSYYWARGDLDELRVPRPPLISVDAIEYRAPSGQLVTLDPSAYRVLAGGPDTPGRVSPAPGLGWPATQWTPGAVRVRFTAGYGAAAASVPETTAHAILLLVGLYYENREAANVGNIVTEIPLGVRTLIEAERWGRFA